jgi:phosphoribosylformylglycinamidine synthase II
MSVYAITLTHREGPNSPVSQATSKKLLAAGMKTPGVTADSCYLIEGDLSAADAARAGSLLADPVLETWQVTEGKIPAGVGAGSGSVAAAGSTQVTILRQPGVMDPAEASVLRSLADSGVKTEAVRCATVYSFPKGLGDGALKAAAAALHNPAVEEYHAGETAFPTLHMGRGYIFKAESVAIRSLDDAALKALSSARGLSMNIAEMRAVAEFFRNEKRDPTDVELEMVAQTWSEHCKHKTLTGPVVYEERARDGAGDGEEGGEIEDSLHDLMPGLVGADGRIRGILQSTIKRATEELAKPFCLSVFVDNAGVIAFDEKDALCIKVETHNHPSAIEPYGGAGTGIGGVIRDILGTGLGAKPIANTDVFCFGPADLAAERVPKGALHPLTVMRGVVSGVRDYGNRMGIPTVNGAVCFDARYTGNPLVYAGSIGMLPRNCVNKAACEGDAIVAVGGRTGRDGIGGATFSSAELTHESETVSSGAVQIGNAIQEKIVLDTMIEARRRGLYSAVTDCGAGGFSSAVGEMGEEIGAHVELTKAPLKYAGLSYREIWLSEAQERMVFAVPPKKLAEFLALFASEDVETAVLGTFGAKGRMLVEYDGNRVLDMPMSFLHGGLPRVERTAVWQPGVSAGAAAPWLAFMRKEAVAADDAAAVLTAILASPNVCSKEWIVRQYDHEVQAMSAGKPFAGVHNDGPADGAVLCPKPGASGAAVVACGLNPLYGDHDPYWMAIAAVDEAVRNAVCCGGDVTHTAILDNFSWGNCDKPDRLGGLVRAAAGCYVAAKALGTPFVSGKDSLNNEFATESGTVAIPPTLLVTALSVTDLKRITTMDLKAAGNVLYQIGVTADEFAGSHFGLVTGTGGGELPKFEGARALACYMALNKAQAAGLIRSAHDCSEGGLAVALAEMAMAGGLGADVALSVKLAGAAGPKASEALDRTLLFAESLSRIVIEVTPKHVKAVEEHFTGLPLTKLGTVTDKTRIKIAGTSGEALIDAKVEELRTAWKSPLYRAVGEPVPADV